MTEDQHPPSITALNWIGGLGMLWQVQQDLVLMAYTTWVPMYGNGLRIVVIRKSEPVAVHGGMGRLA
jgi:hypothetical protein